jgi:hypothetical protein
MALNGSQRRLIELNMMKNSRREPPIVDEDDRNALIKGILSALIVLCGAAVVLWAVILIGSWIF